MENFLLKFTNNHNLLYKAVLVPITAFCIVFFFPKGKKFPYEFRKGIVWQYDNLNAPYDFSVEKSESEKEQEKSEAIKNSPLCFRHSNETGEREINEFAERIYLLPVFSAIGRKGEKKRNGIAEIEKAKKILEHIYFRGYSLEKNPGSEVLILFRNNSAEEIPVKQIYFPETANAYIESQTEGWEAETKRGIVQLLKNHLRENIFLDAKLTAQFREDALRSVSTHKGKISAGEQVVAKGEMITEEKFQILESLRNDFQWRFPERNRIAELTGKFLLVLISLSLLMIFLFLFRKDIFTDNKKIFFFLLILFLMTLLYNWSVKSSRFSPYLVPLCLVPVVIRTFFDTRLALYAHLVLILILGIVAPDGFEFLFIQLTSGMVAIFSIVNLRNRSQFFFSSSLIFLAGATGWISIALIKEGGLTGIDFENLKWFAGNALLTLLAYPVIYATEKLFGFVSDVSLLELSDSNTPLLRELASRAPGTFQHSLQVANLAESVIYSIGGNTLMVRAGALYHDIGKMETPVYFIENQISSLNPHDEISFEESAAIIISHVPSGIEIAKKNKLPDQLIDFIRTHHGNSKVQYFYRSFLKNFPDELIDEKKFRYPGPLPYSKETAVVMMADSVEAAARSLKRPDEQAIENLVETVIENLVNEKQFSNCNITFRDIHISKKIFRKMLSSIHHTRVDYPI